MQNPEEIPSINFEKQHYHLFFIAIIYQNKQGTNFENETNASLVTKEREITLQDISRLQMGAIEKFGNDNPKILKDHSIIGVNIKSINYLGHMTQEKFMGKMSEEKSNG